MCVQVQYPDCGDDAFPLMRRLHFEPVYKDAIMQVGCNQAVAVPFCTWQPRPC